MARKPIVPPWDALTVANLNAFQKDGKYHPFTCPNDDHDPEQVDLVATADGWVCRAPGCEYTQGWAHAFMADRWNLTKPTELREVALESGVTDVYIEQVIKESFGGPGLSAQPGAFVDIIPPWDEDTVAALNLWQEGRAAFTCPDSPHGDDSPKQKLVATADGWVCPSRVCNYTQKWAHPFMAGPDLSPDSYPFRGENPPSS